MIHYKSRGQSKLQFFSELRGVLGSAKGIDESLECGDGGVDLENARSHSLRSVLLSVDHVLPRRKWPSSLQILKAHDCSFSISVFVKTLTFSRKLVSKFSRERDGKTKRPEKRGCSIERLGKTMEIG